MRAVGEWPCARAARRPRFVNSTDDDSAWMTRIGGHGQMRLGRRANAARPAVKRGLAGGQTRPGRRSNAASEDGVASVAAVGRGGGRAAASLSGCLRRIISRRRRRRLRALVCRRPSCGGEGVGHADYPGIMPGQGRRGRPGSRACFESLVFCGWALFGGGIVGGVE